MKTFRIFGKLTDFHGLPMQNGVVSIKDSKMNDAYLTYTDENGDYSFEVAQGDYVAIGGVKDYIDSNLEYWCWNLPVYQNMEIDMRINRLELYAINAFLIQRSIQNASLMIYFRPMSLTYYLNNKAVFEDNNCNFINVMPPITHDEIKVFINNKPVKILELSQISEQAMDKGLEGKYLFGYLIQVPMDEMDKSQTHQKIHIVLTATETGEKGEGSLFWEMPSAYNV